MEVLFGILMLLMAGYWCFMIYLEQKKYFHADTMAACGALCTVLIITGLSIIKEHFNPSVTPMDVYQGRTTLEITCKDGVAIDSVIVWNDI